MRNRSGFTLVEIMVMVGIFGLLVALSIPSFNNYVQSNRLSTSTDRLAADLKMARSLAIASGRVHRLAATADGYMITDPVAGRVVRDRDFDGGVQLLADATVDFFPWGMADATDLDLENCMGNRKIVVLPTGMVEVE